jgi:hypothetical protein
MWNSGGGGGGLGRPARPIRSTRAADGPGEGTDRGQVKTRLPSVHRPRPQIVEACLADTLSAAVASGADRVVLVLEGQVGAWCPPGVDVIPQVSGTLGGRLAAGWEAVDGPAVQNGMDTPQVTAELLDAAMARVVDRPTRPGSALVGLAEDGGWWLLGLQRWCPGAFDGVPMSSPQAGVVQIERLGALGLAVERFTELRDIDVASDLFAVAALAPGTRVAAVCRALASVVHQR